jgi:hypothetical protein
MPMTGLDPCGDPAGYRFKTTSLEYLNGCSHLRAVGRFRLCEWTEPQSGTMISVESLRLVRLPLPTTWNFSRYV